VRVNIIEAKKKRWESGRKTEPMSNRLGTSACSGRVWKKNKHITRSESRTELSALVIVYRRCVHEQDCESTSLSFFDH
jgi:hypothetical protein